MPIQINEIIIRAVVDPKGKESREDSKIKPEEKEEIVAECVEQVIEILKEKEER